MAAPTNAASEDSPCQPGAVHTWPEADLIGVMADFRFTGDGRHHRQRQRLLRSVPSAPKDEDRGCTVVSTHQRRACPTPSRTVLERKVHVCGAVSGALVAMRATKTKQDTDILGGPGRTRTCSQTVLSGGIIVAAVKFPALFVEFDNVRCASCGLLLVRNRCESSVVESWTRALRSLGDNVRTQLRPSDRRHTASCRLIAAACQGQRLNARI